MKSARWPFALVTLVATPLVACGEEETPFEVIEQVAFHPSLGIDLAAMTRLPEGVYIRDDVVGSGPLLAADDTAVVQHYGWLRDGTVFSEGEFTLIYLATQPSPDPLIVDDMIEGVEIGFEGMAAGGTRVMIVPPELGYGRNPPLNSIIPEGAVLVFEFTITSIN